MIRVLAMTVKPVLAAETRYRIVQYLDRFRKVGIQVDHVCLMDEAFYRLHIRDYHGHMVRKLFCYVRACVWMLCRVVRALGTHDVFWVSREISPVGPPFIEKMICLRGKKIVLDIDDAIYLHDPASSSFIHHHLRDFGKFTRIGPHYDHIVCGNKVLADYFRRLNPQVSIIPTVVSMQQYQNVTHTPPGKKRLRIGWIGTPSNYTHFSIVKGPVQRLSSCYDFEFETVGLGKALAWEGVNTLSTPWRLERELDFFSQFDIGIMPLHDTPFSRGKCAFKIVQYMAAGIPVVASPVGANQDVIQDGINGFLARTAEEWYEKLALLLTNPALRKIMGERGRETVQIRYSLESQWERYADIFKTL